MENWKKNLYVIFFAEMIAITGMNFVVPFLPFYIKELGISGTEQITHWSSWLMGAPALAMILVSPFWGYLADRLGRKPMIERAMFGGAISIFLMAWASNVYQLLILRLIQGALAGTVAACIALVSASSPSKKMGFSLGLVQTGIFLGNFLGPLLGGLSADILGFRNSFKITGILLFIAGWLIFFLVEEKFIPSTKKEEVIPFKKSMALFFNNQQLFIMLFILFLVQFSVMIINPFFALFMVTIVTDPKTISALTGLMFAITGLISAFSSVNMGKLNEKIPGKFLLTISLLGTGCFFLLQGFVTNVTQLALLRFGLGFFYGGIIPTANTIISLLTPPQDRGKVFGIANSTTFLGNIFGPIAGAFIITTFNLTSVFVFTGGILLLAGLALPAIIKKSEKTKIPN
jgi:DHA1 family multidrug resistance protein-like MFS transporter